MPLALLVRVPLVGVVQPVQVVVAVAGLRLPLGSWSLPATLMVTGVSAGVVAVSSPASGGALGATGVFDDEQFAAVLSYIRRA